MVIFNSEHTKNLLSISLIRYISITFSRINYEFTIFFAKIIWKHYLFREFTMDLLFFMRIHYEFTICFVNSLYFFNQIVCIVYWILYPDKMSLRHSHSDSYAMCHVLWVIFFSNLWTRFDRNFLLTTWGQKIAFESEHMNIIYDWTKQPDLTLFDMFYPNYSCRTSIAPSLRRFDPSLTCGDLWRSWFPAKKFSKSPIRYFLFFKMYN